MYPTSVYRVQPGPPQRPGAPPGAECVVGSRAAPALLRLGLPLETSGGSQPGAPGSVLCLGSSASYRGRGGCGLVPAEGQAVSRARQEEGVTLWVRALGRVSHR